MIDFTKIFNIVFVSVCAALILFLLISAIVVAAKGKRKCGAFDVILRILSTLVFIAAVVMLFAAILAMLDPAGSMCIVVAQVGDKAAALLAIGGDIIELPLPELFVALSTVIGFGLSAVLFMLSLTALIVDCLVANKKSDEKQKNNKQPKVQKTPEQLKREAELERIRKIGESAVRKTSSVASADKSEQTEHSVDKNSESEQAAKPAPEQNDEPDFDWRAEPKAAEHPASFVGIKDEQDDFDSFDSFDTQPEQTEENNEQPEEQVEEQAEEQDDFDLDNIVEQSEESNDVSTEEQPYDESEQVDVEDENSQLLDEQVDDVYEQAEDQDEEPEQDDDMSAWQFEVDNAQNADSDDVTEEAEVADDADEVDIPDNADVAEEYSATQAEQVKPSPVDGIEPDRGIYIPKIRTVTRGAAGTPTQRPTPVKKPIAKPAAKPTTKSAAKPAAKTTKPATKKPAAKPKRSGGGKAQKPAASSIPPEKKLPVTRRYVILDRHNAVNMFGEYLKERNQAEKDKLKSSINTIIIE